MGSEITAIVSVVASSIVAVVALVAGLGPLLFQWAKWRKEEDDLRKQALQAPMHHLLEALARAQALQAQYELPGDTVFSVYASLLTSYYKWEQIVWASLADAERERLASLRSSLNIIPKSDRARSERGWEVAGYFAEKGPSLATEILDITQLAEAKKR